MDKSVRNTCLSILKFNGDCILFRRDQDLELCLEGVRMHKDVLRIVKPEFKTREVCRIAVEKFKDAIQYVPKEYKDIHQAWEIMYG